jgi:hypothetical protein
VLGNLPLNARQDLDELVRSLEERFSPSNQSCIGHNCENAVKLNVSVTMDGDI